MTFTIRPLLFTVVCALFLQACSGSGIQSQPAGTPLDREHALKESRGKISGDGFSLFGGDKNKELAGGAIGVNSFLWRATLDTLSFMPLASADPFGGVIITDWYEDPSAPGERFKVNATILDSSLRADGVKVALFKQKKDGAEWKDEKVDPTLPRQLEDTILTRARQLRVSQLSE